MILRETLQFLKLTCVTITNHEIYDMIDQHVLQREQQSEKVRINLTVTCIYQFLFAITFAMIQHVSAYSTLS